VERDYRKKKKGGHQKREWGKSVQKRLGEKDPQTTFDLEKKGAVRSKRNSLLVGVVGGVGEEKIAKQRGVVTRWPRRQEPCRGKKERRATGGKNT